jgi:glycosyltransferase involved in cell wall biosynthesis
MSDLFCSVTIPTIGRSSLIEAVQSVLTQEFPMERFEIIIVNDSRAALPQAPLAREANVRILNTNRVERSFARNCGAAIARGRFLVFLDDDDRILPGALDRFWQLTRQHEAGMYYGGYRFVDAEGTALDEFPMKAGTASFGLCPGSGSLCRPVSSIRTLFMRSEDFYPSKPCVVVMRMRISPGEFYWSTIL